MMSNMPAFLSLREQSPNSPWPGRTRWVMSCSSLGEVMMLASAPMAIKALWTLWRFPAP